MLSSYARTTPTACNFAALRKFFQVLVSTGTQTIQGVYLKLNNGTVPYTVLGHGRLQSHLLQYVIQNESNPVTVIRHALANVKDELTASLQNLTPIVLYYLLQNAQEELTERLKNRALQSFAQYRHIPMFSNNRLSPKRVLTPEHVDLQKPSNQADRLVMILGSTSPNNVKERRQCPEHEAHCRRYCQFRQESLLVFKEHIWAI